MLALIQRVNYAKVSVKDKIVGQINAGYCVFLGVHKNDSEIDINYLIKKLTTLKLNSADKAKFSRAINPKKESILVISQFTLYAKLGKGTTPSFSDSMSPTPARKLYLEFCDRLSKLGYNVEKGSFGAYMQVELENDGPATFILSSDHLHG